METTPTINEQTEIMDIFGLSQLLKMKPSGIRNRLSRGYPMPRSFVLPGGSKRLWRRADVLAWIDAQAKFTEPSAEPPRRRGRPTKVEAVARASRKAVAKTNGEN